MNRMTAIVSGRVQGVGFRYFVQNVARELGLSGYVRNTPSGDVEVVAEGDAVALEEMRQRLAQGPPLARVDNVEDELSLGKSEFSSFGVRF